MRDLKRSLPKPWVIGFGIITVGLMAGAYGYSARFVHGVEATEASNLKYINEISLQQISEWRTERLRDVKAHATGVVRDELLRWIQSPADLAARTVLLDHWQVLQAAYGYQDVILVNGEGNVLLRLTGSTLELEPQERALARAAGGRGPITGDYFRMENSEEPSLDTAAPVYDQAGHAAAVLMIRARPGDHLFPAGTWPTPDQSAETFLVKKDGSDLLILQPHRRQGMPIPPARSVWPGAGQELSSDLAAGDAVRRVDRDGSEVFSVVTPVANSDWLIVTEADTKEMRADVAFRRGLIVLVVVLAIILTGMAINLGLEHRRFKDSEAHFRTLADSAQALIWTVDEDKRCTYVNRAWVAFTGRSETRSRGTGWLDAVHPEDAERSKRTFSSAFERQVRFTMDCRLRRFDGVYRWMQDSGSPQFDSQGRFVGYVGYCVDITDRREAQETLEAQAAELRTQNAALIASEAKSRSIFEGSPDALFLIGPDGHFSEVNDVAVSRYGYTRDELLRMGPLELSDEELKDTAEDRVRLTNQMLARLPEGPVTASPDRTDAPMRSSEGAVSFEWKHRRKEGGGIPVEITAVRIGQDEGRTGILAVARDITERKRHEAEQLKLQAQLVQAQKMESIGRLAGGIAHDFNNLLTVINGYSDLLLGNMKPQDPAYESVSEIKQAGTRASDLTRQLLTFSRRQIVHTEILHLNTVITDSARMIRRLLGGEIQFSTELLPEDLHVVGDAGQLSQVILNLAVNARDAMPAGGNLTLTTSRVVVTEANSPSGLRPGVYARLAVTDTGTGMDEETQKRIFEPFFTTKTVGQGTGLGLATVYGIVAQAGGGIDVVSSLGHGSTFSILWPTTEELAVDEGPLIADLDEAGGGETILVVDDQEDVLMLTSVLLKALGYEVLTALSGREALACSQAYSQRIDLLLTDVVMPGINGRELADRLQPLRPEMRVLFMSGFTEDRIMSRTMLEPDTALLPKPFTRKVLAGKVREVLDAVVSSTDA